VVEVVGALSENDGKTTQIQWFEVIFSIICNIFLII
jgi:hypothetical protein